MDENALTKNLSHEEAALTIGSDLVHAFATIISQGEDTQSEIRSTEELDLLEESINTLYETGPDCVERSLCED